MEGDMLGMEGEMQGNMQGVVGDTQGQSGGTCRVHGGLWRMATKAGWLTAPIHLPATERSPQTPTPGDNPRGCRGHPGPCG